MSQYEVHRGDNPRILFFLWIVLAASVVLIGGLGSSQLIDIRKYQEIENAKLSGAFLPPALAAIFMIATPTYWSATARTTQQSPT